MRTFEEIDNLTIQEYQTLVKAYKFRKLDKERDMHFQAFLQLKVQAVNKKGEYVYSEFDDFFDEKEAMERIGIKTKAKNNITERSKRLARIASQVNRKGVSRIE